VSHGNFCHIFSQEVKEVKSFSWQIANCKFKLWYCR